jgi:two-component system OmpR family sensor kinase
VEEYGLIQKKTKEQLFTLNYQSLTTKNMDNFSLISLITHELRTPLTAIRGYSSLLIQNKLINEDSKNILEKVHIDVVKEIYVLNDASQLLKFELKKGESVKDTVNMYKFVQERIEHYKQEEGDEKKLKFEIKSPNGLSVKISKEYVEMLIDFLLKHSARGSSKKSRIFMEIEKDKESVNLKIHENVPTIHSENGSLPEEPFYIKNEQHEDNPYDLRSGLELYICNQVVSQIEGAKLRVSSRGSKGNTFDLTIPINNK